MKFTAVGNNTRQIEKLSELAVRIVREHFDPIIGPEQNDYMIRKFQSTEAIAQQLSEGYQYYFVVDDASENIGFLAFYPQKDTLYLSKFYLLKTHRGKGIAKDMLAFAVCRARDAGLHSMTLNVNRHNSAAIRAYEKLGFRKIREETNAIGNGYVMDDFVYRYDFD